MSSLLVLCASYPCGAASARPERAPLTTTAASHESSARAVEAIEPSSQTGTLGDCTITLSSGRYWRSAILGGPRGSSPDGFGPMDVAVDAHVECASSARLSVARAWAVVGTVRDALHRPDLHLTREMTPWDGRVSAGVPVDVTFTWHDGPFSPGRAGGNAHAVVRFRSGRATLELDAPARDVAFPS